MFFFLPKKESIQINLTVNFMEIPTNQDYCWAHCTLGPDSSSSSSSYASCRLCCCLRLISSSMLTSCMVVSSHWSTSMSESWLPGFGGRIFSSDRHWLGESAPGSGNSTLNSTNRRPFMKGRPCWGMPSSFMALCWPIQTKHINMCRREIDLKGWTERKIKEINCFNRIAQQANKTLKKSFIPGLITSPGLDFIRSCRPSRWVRTNWKPHRASVSEIVCSTYKSSYFLLNFAWSLSCNTKTMSPVTVSGWKHNLKC